MGVSRGQRGGVTPRIQHGPVCRMRRRSTPRELSRERDFYGWFAVDLVLYREPQRLSPASVPTTRQAYRTSEAVDVSVLGNQAGYNVGWTRPGEFLRYTVDVDKSGESVSA